MFKKILLTYLSILILVMAVLSLTISSLAENYVYAEKRGLLQNVADRAAGAASAYASEGISRTELGGIIDSMAFITDTKIYVVNSDIAANIDIDSRLAGQYLKDALARVLDGESVFLKRQYAAGFDAQMLFLAAPWRDGGEIKGAVLLFSPEKEIASIAGSIQLAIWLTAAAFVLIGGFIIFFFSRRIVMPIKGIDEASAKMAVGEHAYDIDIASKDELGSLARSFNSMKQKIEANEALRQDLIANISHDLRTPVTNINGYLSGMADGVIDRQDYPKYIAILKKETRRLMELTEGILDAAKIQSGSIELNITNFPLRSAVDGAVRANLEFAKSRNVQIKASIDSKLCVNADMKKIEQALSNLINNAVKFSPAGGAVAVYAEAADKGIKIYVEDNGIGIDAKDLPFIFKRFYRQGSQSGFGLGLSIVKTYIEAHGSSIDINSSPGNGTIVCFILSS